MVFPGRRGGVELIAKVRNDLADELRLQRGKDLCPPLIHTPLVSVPSLVDTGHIWLRVLPAVVMLADIQYLPNIKQEIFGILNVISLLALPRVHGNLGRTKVRQPHSSAPPLPRLPVWTSFKVLVPGWQGAGVLHQIAEWRGRLSPAVAFFG